MLRHVSSRVVEHSVGVDESGWRRTEPDPGRGQSHAAVSAGRGVATESDQPGAKSGRSSPRQLQPDSEPDAHTGQQCHVANPTTVGAGAAFTQSQSDWENI